MCTPGIEMDDSWRMKMGMGSGLPCRRSTEDVSTAAGAGTAAAATNRRSMEALEPEDFSDVFGGPPRSVLSRKFSGDFATSSSPGSFYEEVFRPLGFFPLEKKGGRGRSLPAFRIPARGEGFYGDVFRSDEGRRSRDRSRPNSKAKSKSNSSSVLSSEELSPHRRPVSGDDVALSTFASRLRPINVPYRWNSTTNTMQPEEQTKKQGIPPFQCSRPSYADNYYMENEYNENFKNSYFRVSRQVSSPEIISFEPNSYRSIEVSVDDLELNSPSSPVSSLCEGPEVKATIQHGTIMQEDEMMDQEDDEVMSSYVIEINSDHREGNGEAASIDEAIAWAKEKFQAHSYDGQPEKDQCDDVEDKHDTDEALGQQMDGRGNMQSPKMEMELLDEDIRLWSTGKETNIRLLLSTLHHILWPNSGWHAIAITSLIESPQVKKAYQKARLRLHPDKLQQRGATLSQKYVAEKAFSILQDAWSAFVSHDVFFN